MKPGVGERKWEVDSLCYPVRLAHEYWRITHDTKPFDAQWARAMHAILETFTAQQRKTSRGPYHFQREAFSPYDTLSEDGYGNPARPIGLIYSGFRPSDDACIYPLEHSGQLFRREHAATHRRDAHRDRSRQRRGKRGQAFCARDQGRPRRARARAAFHRR